MEVTGNTVKVYYMLETLLSHMGEIFVQCYCNLDR